MANKVAFTAVAEYDGPVGPGGAITLVFNTVITNIGGGYDNTSGIFTAPYAGLYFFIFSYHGVKQTKSGLQLIKGDKVIVQSFDDERSPYTADNAGNSAFLQLNAGEQVFVRLPADRVVWASNSSTSLSGYLVG